MGLPTVEEKGHLEEGKAEAKEGTEEGILSSFRKQQISPLAEV